MVRICNRFHIILVSTEFSRVAAVERLRMVERVGNEKKKNVAEKGGTAAAVSKGNMGKRLCAALRCAVLR